MWHSNAPWAGTGYGVQTALVTRRLRDAGHDVAISAYYGLEGAVLNWEGIPVYPTDHTRLNKYRLHQYVQHWAKQQACSADDVIVISLGDIWPYIDRKYGGSAFFHDLRFANWTPIDHYPVPPRVLTAISELDAVPIAMSQYGREQLEAAGVDDPLYAPHGVDTSIFKPSDGAALRAAMKVPQDAFVVGMVANNQGSAPPRKAFPQVFQAFARLLEKHDDAFLFLHADVYGFYDGINLIALADIIGIPSNRIASTDQAAYHLGLDQQLLAHIYSACDVLANPSFGEGFGVPIVEAQACGTPVIVTDWTSMPELLGAGWKVLGDHFYNPPHGAFFMAPSVHEILTAFESAYERRGDEQLSKQAVEFAQRYDADRVFDEHWHDVVDEIAQRTALPVLEEVVPA